MDFLELLKFADPLLLSFRAFFPLRSIKQFSLFAINSLPTTQKFLGIFLRFLRDFSLRWDL